MSQFASIPAYPRDRQIGSTLAIVILFNLTTFAIAVQPDPIRVLKIEQSCLGLSKAGIDLRRDGATVLLFLFKEVV